MAAGVHLHRSRPISPDLAQACISSATVGSPERLKAVGIAPSSRINQLLFNLIRSAGFVPDSVANKARPAYLFPDLCPPHCTAPPATPRRAALRPSCTPSRTPSRDVPSPAPSLP